MADYGLQPWAYEMNKAAAEIAVAAARAYTREDAGQAALRHRLHGPHQPHASLSPDVDNPPSGPSPSTA
jgi:5-methyltetrahydrofolate--homocysteine methyltransferase